MEIYNVGPDELEIGDFEYYGRTGYIWAVVDYHDGGYDGYGEAVCLTPNDELHFYSLSHCSCYGPLDSSPDVVSLEKYLSSDVLSDIENSEIKKKVNELLTSDLITEAIKRKVDNDNYVQAFDACIAGLRSVWQQMPKNVQGALKENYEIWDSHEIVIDLEST